MTFTTKYESLLTFISYIKRLFFVFTKSCNFKGRPYGKSSKCILDIYPHFLGYFTIAPFTSMCTRFITSGKPPLPSPLPMLTPLKTSLLFMCLFQQVLYSVTQTN